MRTVALPCASILILSISIFGCGTDPGANTNDLGGDDGHDGLFVCRNRNTDSMNNPCYGSLPDQRMEVVDVCGLFDEYGGTPGERYSVVDFEYDGALRPSPIKPGVSFFSFTSTITFDSYQDWSGLPGTQEIDCYEQGQVGFVKPNGTSRPDSCESVMSVDRICRCRGRTTTSYQDIRVLHAERGVTGFEGERRSGTLKSSCFLDDEAWLIADPFYSTMFIGSIHLIMRVSTE